MGIVLTANIRHSFKFDVTKLIYSGASVEVADSKIYEHQSMPYSNNYWRLTSVNHIFITEYRFLIWKRAKDLYLFNCEVQYWFFVWITIIPINANKLCINIHFPHFNIFICTHGK